MNYVCELCGVLSCNKYNPVYPALFILSLIGFTPPEIKCKDPLGIESGKIPSTSIAASSQYNQYWGPGRGRLRMVKEGSYGGGWAAKYADAKQFLLFDFGKVTKVTAAATQGRSDANWMVTSYTLAYSLDAVSFTPYGKGDGQVSHFPSLASAWITQS